MASTHEPSSIRAGDSVSWSRTVAGYLASAGWGLAYRLVPRVGGTPIDIAAGVAGDAFAVSLASSATAGWAAGEYTLVGVVTKGTERATIYGAPCEILPNLMTAAAADTRSPAQIIVAAIDAWVSGKAGWAGEKQVGDRRIKDHPLPDLIALREHYARIVAGEAALQMLLTGSGGGGRVNVRM